MRRKLAACLLLVVSICAGALEDDELRIGMSEAAVVSVFTQHRSCANVVLEEGPGWLAWEARLRDRPARVEVSFSEGRAARIVFRFTLEVDESGREFLAALVADESLRQGTEPAPSGEGRFRWDSPGRTATAELSAAGDGWEARITLEAVSGARP